MSKKTEAPEPMDASIREVSTGTVAANNKRPCWAIKTLVAEVHALFPETPYEVSDYNGRNVGLDVSFDCSMLIEEDQVALVTLFDAVRVDPRVEEVDFAEDQAFVSMRPDARTQDSREPFGLAEAWEVLTEGDDGGESDLIGWVDKAQDFPSAGYLSIPDRLSFGGSL